MPSIFDNWVTMKRCRFSLIPNTLAVLVFLGSLPLAEARSLHPVPRRAHDRTIVVRLGSDKIIVDYRLEVDEFTVVYDDLPAFSDQIDLTRLTKPDEFYELFIRCYAPVLAGNLIAKLDGMQISSFTCTRRTHTLRDDLGQKLGHLRCDFQFEASWEIFSEGSHEFHFRESNYELEEGRIRLSVQAVKGIHILSKVEPDKKLQEKPPNEWKPGDQAKLRTARARFVISSWQSDVPRIDDRGSRIESATGETRPSILNSPSSTLESSSSQPSSLLDLLLDPNRGIWFLLLLAGFFGAVHALAPGHGKTLVAAYLVGEHGTVWHALILGLVTTITHTGAVLALAGILLVVNPERLPNLELFGGLLVTGMGLWLLLRRLAGQADHIHLGGGHHHHKKPNSKIQEPKSNIQDPVANLEFGSWNLEVTGAHSQQHPISATAGGWWGLVALGVSGGIVPCYDAIVMLIFAISARRLSLALPLLLAFSTGLAGVLILIGILVVQVKGFASSRLGVGRWFKSLPILSSILVIVLGLFLCYQSVHSN